MGWIKLTEEEKTIIVRTAERAKNEHFSTFSCTFRNAILAGADIRVTLDPDEIKKELTKPKE